MCNYDFFNIGELFETLTNFFGIRQSKMLITSVIYHLFSLFWANLFTC